MLPLKSATRGAHAGRSAAIAAAQVPVLSHLRQSGARNIRSYHTINAVAATVTEAEAASLSTHPLVQAVVPDAVIRLPKVAHDFSGVASGSRAAVGAGAGAALCNTLEPEALQLTNTAYPTPDEPRA